MIRILRGDCRDVLPMLDAGSVHCCVTSPPYLGLRRYLPAGHPDAHREIGQEHVYDCLGWATGARCATCFICVLTGVFREVRRVLRDDGVCFVNMGDAYANPDKGGYQNTRTRGDSMQASNLASDLIGAANRQPQGWLKPKDIMMQPHRLALSLQADGWYVRQDIVLHKLNPMPESIRDRCTKAHEYLFLLSKRQRYYWNADAIAEPCSANTHARLAQDVESQQWSLRAHAGEGRGGRPMKAMAPRGYAHSRGVAGWASGPGSHRAADHAQPHDGPQKLPASPKQADDPNLVKDATVSARMGRGAGWRKAYANNGVGFGHGYDAGARQRGRVKNNASFDAAMQVNPETRNKRSVWTFASEPYRDAHFATFGTELVRTCLLAGCPEGGTALDPFGGSGTVGLVADRMHRHAVLIDLNDAYADMMNKRITLESPLFAEVEDQL